MSDRNSSTGEGRIPPKPSISVVVPAFNERNRLRVNLPLLIEYLDPRPAEILVVDDGSTDGTGELVEQLAHDLVGPVLVRLIKNGQNRGKGFSVRRGMLEAAAPLALFTDADLSTPIAELSKLEAAVADSHVHAAIGSRDVEGSRVEVHQSVLRESAGKLFNLMVRGLVRLPFRDTQCGFKLFKTEHFRPVFEQQRLDRFSFDVEILVIAGRQGLKVVEIPVVWKHDPGSRVRFLRDGFRMLVDLLRIHWNTLTGAYKRRK